MEFHIENLRNYFHKSCGVVLGLGQILSIDLLEDIEYFLKKMNWNKQDLENYIGRSEKLHSEYPNEKRFWNFAKKIHGLIFR